MKTSDAFVRAAPASVTSPEDDVAGDDALRRAIDLLRSAQFADAGFAQQEQDALEAIYRAYFPSVRDTVYPLLASAADAEDVAQQVFIGLPRALRRYEHGNFEGWLRRVAARTALMRLREDRRVEHTMGRVAASAISEDRGWHVALTGEDEIGLDERMGAVRRAFYALPEALREVVFLRAIVELSHAEIADWLEISVAASYTRYCRGLQQVRRMMGVDDA